MKAKKVLALVLCAALLVAGSVAATLAYLTSTTGVVTNTFTTGNVAITLDETDVDEYGVAVPGAARVMANEYKLIPGHTYVKDPTVHVQAGSEECYLFVKIENGLEGVAEIEFANSWDLIDEENGIYAHEPMTAGSSSAVFTKFTFDADADPADYEEAEIKVTAYAVQADGFETAEEAWDATFGDK